MLKRITLKLDREFEIFAFYEMRKTDVLGIVKSPQIGYAITRINKDQNNQQCFNNLVFLNEEK